MPDDSGYFDLQVNGYGGGGFGDDALAPQALHAAGGRLEAGGPGGILAALTTQRPDAMVGRLRRPLAAPERGGLAAAVVTRAAW